MKYFFTTCLFYAMVMVTNAQTSNLVFFADQGELFTVYVNGERKNASPASNVKVTNLTGDGVKARVVFENAQPELNKFVMLTAGEETTLSIVKNKKGNYTFRLVSSAPIASAETTPTYTSTSNASTTTNTASTPATSTSETVTMTTTSSNGMNANISMSVDGISVSQTVSGDGEQSNVSMNINLPVSEVTTTTTTSTTSSSSSSYSSSSNNNNNTSSSTSSGRDWSLCGMESMDYNDLVSSVKSKSFSDAKMTVIKQALKHNCVTTAQVKGLAGLFSFEEDKLDFAKFAYDYTSDKNNYYKINDVFQFETTIDELNEYLESK